MLRKEPRRKGGFKIIIETGTNLVTDPAVGAYQQHIVAANGFVIAHFVDMVSRDTYIGYLEKYGMDAWKHFPKKILAILEHMAGGRPIDITIHGKK